MAMWSELSVKQMRTSSGASSLVAHSSVSQLFVGLIGLLLAKILFMIGGSLLVPALLNLIEDTQCDTHPTLNYIALYSATTVVSKCANKCKHKIHQPNLVKKELDRHI